MMGGCSDLVPIIPLLQGAVIIMMGGCSDLVPILPLFQGAVMIMIGGCEDLVTILPLLQEAVIIMMWLFRYGAHTTVVTGSCHDYDGWVVQTWCPYYRCYRELS